MTEKFRIDRRFVLRATAAGSLAAFMQRLLAAGEMPGASRGMRTIKGEVLINGKQAEIGQKVGQRDTVMTGANSQATYTVDQNAFLQREASVVRFGSNPTEDYLRVVTGKILSVFGTGNKKIVVGNTTIGIRGAACYIEDDSKLTYFCLCYGETEVVPTAAPELRKIIVSRHHDHPIYIETDANPSQPIEADLKNHSDVELILLESLFSRSPPFLALAHS